MSRCRISDLRCKEVVNVCDGKRLGFATDFEINVCDGRICAIIVPGECNFLGFSRGAEIVIPWERIERFGEDIILVKIEFSEVRRCEEERKRRRFF